MVAGYGLTCIGIAEQSLLQAAVSSEMRGRVLSIYTLIHRGFPSIGALIMGTAASYIGLRLPVLGGAVIFIMFWIWARQRQARMIDVLETPPEARTAPDR